jgi:hypothetical protein
MEKRQFVYYAAFNDGYSCEMGSIDERTVGDAIHRLWHDVLMCGFEAGDFNGVVMLYDTVKRERVNSFFRQ